MSQSQEKRLFGLVLVLVIVVALLAGFAVYALYTIPRGYQPMIQSQNAETKTITVSGTGTVSMTPDIGWFTASVVTQATTAAQAQDANSNAMRGITDALKNAGVAGQDIQTTEYGVSPVYAEQCASCPQQELPKILGYTVRHSIQITVNSLNDMGKMIDLAISSGANEVSGVYFGLSSTLAQQAQTSALGKAISDANGKATAITAAMGTKLMGPVSVSLGYYYSPTSVDMLRAESAQVPISPGQLQYTVTVQVVYAFA